MRYKKVILSISDKMTRFTLKGQLILLKRNYLPPSSTAKTS